MATAFLIYFSIGIGVMIECRPRPFREELRKEGWLLCLGVFIFGVSLWPISLIDTDDDRPWD